MSAYDMFKKLDGVFSVDVSKTHNVGYGEYDIIKVTLNYVDSKKNIVFDGFNETYYAENVDSQLHLAIHQKIIELGWLK
jgi:hypothetical protein